MTDPARLKEIFVYGTLMRGGLYAELMQRGELKFVGAARCRGRLYDLGEYPGMIAGGGGWVAGELYRSSEIARTLPVLDDLESTASFERRVVEVDWPHGPSPAWCWVYVGDLSGVEPVTGGSWRAHLRRRRRSG